MKKIIVLLMVSLIVLFSFSLNANANSTLILVDPGHGGIDGGTGRGQLLEKNLNLDISLRTRDWLQKEGFVVKLTRESDTDLSSAYPSPIQSRHKRDLQNRLVMIRKESPALFISIHVNSSTQPKDKGPLVFYAVESEKGKELATEVQSALNQVAMSTQRPVGRKNLFLIRHAPCPGVLAEMGFVTNDTDALRLLDASYRDRMARAIAEAVQRYLQWSIRS